MVTTGVLDQAAVVEAACRLTARVGAKALTMRMLAEELGVSAMAAYRHVPSKKALLVLVADAISSRVEVPPAEAGTWQDRIRMVEIAAFRELSTVPDLWDVIAPELDYPNRRRLVDGVVEILLEAGFGPKRAALAHETLFGYVMGQLRMRRLLGPAAPGEAHPANPVETAALQLGSVTVDGHREPISVDEYFEFGLRVVLEGLASELEHAR